MLESLPGYSKARHELTLRIESLDSHIERGKASIQNLKAELEAREAGLLNEMHLRDGYQQILALTPTEVGAAL